VSAIPPPQTAGVEAAQRNTVRVLVVSQALGGLGTTVGIAVASVLAEEVSGSEALAGMVQTFQVLGAAAASYLLARIMGARGRRVGLAVGYLVGAAGAATCVVGGVVDSFALLLAGALLLGANSATNYQSRYAAADLAVPERRARALSVVLWATTLGAVLGPNLVGPAGRMADRWGLPALTGPFVVTVGVAVVAALVLWTFLRPDPLLLARTEAGESLTEPRRRTSWARVRELARIHPGIGAAVLAMSASHAVMVAVMIMTPLHMDHGGAELEVIGFVISIHVLGMFFFSPFIGTFADRLGRPATLLAGAAALWAALALAGSAPEGASLRIGAGLFLLGLGWSCATVAASTVIADRTPIEARTDVQGTSDMAMSLTAAGGGALAGVIVGSLGYPVLAGFAALLAGAVVVAGRATGRHS
jgi:MFS family permease